MRTPWHGGQLGASQVRSSSGSGGHACGSDRAAGETAPGSGSSRPSPSSSNDGSADQPSAQNGTLGAPAGAGSGLSGLPSASGSQRFPTPTLHESGSVLATPVRSDDAAPRRLRAKFEPAELADICGRYNLGTIESIKEFRRGSGRSPKVVIKTDRGAFLLKRRAIGRHGLSRITFCHDIQLHLAQRRFPLPQLIRPEHAERSMVVDGGQVYELFEFIAGNSYDQSLDATADAGRALGLFHRLLWSFDMGDKFQPPRSSFHNAGGGPESRGFEEQLSQVEQRLGDAAAAGVLRRLRISYADACRRVEALGYGAWPVQIIHGDWHPGNMLFHGSRVAAVIDYDTARLGPRVIDIANGALQFSMLMGPGDPRQWPPQLDEGRYKRFCRGYETVKDCVISTAELEALPWLMIEALIIEAVVPIAATGSFAGLSGISFLQTVDAKCAWIQQHAARLTGLLCA
jgi:Ser/Thr protein kinase RdoA (MazF antagonist)